MCNDNSKLKTDNIGNRTICRVKRIELKCVAPLLHWKSWDGVKVYTASARYVEWAEFERFPDNDKIKLLKCAITFSELEEDSDENSEVELNMMKKTNEVVKGHVVFRALSNKNYGNGTCCFG